jgi:hypothetical protein
MSGDDGTCVELCLWLAAAIELKMALTSLEMGERNETSGRVLRWYLEHQARRLQRAPIIFICLSRTGDFRVSSEPPFSVV